MKIIAIACVAILVVGGAGAAIVVSNNNDNDSGPAAPVQGSADLPADPLYEAFDFSVVKNLMFGNANNDSHLDTTDLDMVKAFVANPSTWDIAKNPLADTDANGKIEQADVDLLEKILAANSTTEQFKVYYMGCYKNVYSSLFPLRGNMAVDYSTAFDMAVIIGCLDQIKGTRDAQEKVDNYSEKLYPGLKTQVKSMINDSGKFDAEKLAAGNIKIVLGDPYDVPQDLIDKMAKLDPKCTVLHLPVNRVVDGINYVHTIVTLASLMNRQADVADYVSFVENVESKIKTAIENSYAANKTMLIVYNPKSANAISVDCENTMKLQYTDFSNAMLLPFTFALPAMERYMGGMYSGLEAEYIAKVNPEVIILETYNLAASGDPIDKKKEVVAEKLGYINITNAYKNNKVIAIPYEVIGGTAGISTLILMGNLIWGDDYFSATEGWDAINYYYQNFTNMGADVDMSQDANYGYAPVAYGKDRLP